MKSDMTWANLNMMTLIMGLTGTLEMVNGNNVSAALFWIAAALFSIRRN